MSRYVLLPKGEGRISFQLVGVEKIMGEYEGKVYILTDNSLFEVPFHALVD